VTRKTTCVTWGHEANAAERYRARHTAWRVGARLYRTLCGRVDAHAEFVRDSGARERPTAMCLRCWVALQRDTEALDRLSVGDSSE
jgi:hypothetical protein